MDPEPSSLLLTVDINWPLALGVIALLILLIISALISGSEVAFFSLSKTDLDNSEAKSNKKEMVINQLSRPKKLLATILIVNNFINILIVLLFAYLGEFFFSSINYTINLYFIKIPSRFLLEVVLITFLILLFGEVLPKIYANRNALQFATFMALPIRVLNTILTFLSIPLMNLTSVVEKRLGKKKSGFSVETLSQALELTSEEATTKEEQKILEGIVTFGNTETVQVMCPRTDVFFLSDDEIFTEVIKKIIKKGHSRIPVYHENVDEVIGILYTKDLLPHLNKKTFQWKKLMREPFFVPENKN